MAILQYAEHFKTRKGRLNWLLDRLDILVERFLMEEDKVKQEKIYHEIITLTESIEATRRTIEREGPGGDPNIQGELGLTDILLWSDDQ